MLTALVFPVAPSSRLLEARGAVDLILTGLVTPGVSNWELVTDPSGTTLLTGGF